MGRFKAARSPPKIYWPLHLKQAQASGVGGRAPRKNTKKKPRFCEKGTPVALLASLGQSVPCPVLEGSILTSAIEKSKSAPSIEVRVWNFDFGKRKLMMAIRNEVATESVNKIPFCPPVTAVPLFDIQRQTAPLRDEIDAAVSRVFDSGQFVLGPEVKELESQIATYCHANFSVGCASGSDALLLGFIGRRNRFWR